MTTYRLNGKEVSATSAASAWMLYTETASYDMPEAIAIWQDAATASGSDSRKKLAAAHIDVVVSPGDDPPRSAEASGSDD